MEQYKNRTDLIVDFETLSDNELDCAVIDCSVMVFKWDRFLTNPYSFDELVKSVYRVKLDVKSQVDSGFGKVNDETLKFWERQSREVRALILPKDDDLTIEQFAEKFIVMLQNIPKISYWWSRSNTFDPIILSRIMRATGNKDLFNEYLKHWRVQDIRSHINAKFDYTTKNGFVPVSDDVQWNEKFMEHSSRHDVAADVLRLQAIHRAENDMEQIII